MLCLILRRTCWSGARRIPEHKDARLIGRKQDRDACTLVVLGAGKNSATIWIPGLDCRVRGAELDVAAHRLVGGIDDKVKIHAVQLAMNETEVGCLAVCVYVRRQSLVKRLGKRTHGVKRHTFVAGALEEPGRKRGNLGGRILLLESRGKRWRLADGKHLATCCCVGLNLAVSAQRQPRNVGKKE